MWICSAAVKFVSEKTNMNNMWPLTLSWNFAKQTSSKVWLNFCETYRVYQVQFIRSQNTMIHKWQWWCNYVCTPAVQVEQMSGSYWCAASLKPCLNTVTWRGYVVTLLARPYRSSVLQLGTEGRIYRSAGLTAEILRRDLHPLCLYKRWEQCFNPFACTWKIPLAFSATVQYSN